ncbi:MAG: hypothetical protein JXL84_07320 [Deltaproteobacteria bacterium]|nr:hypothetical protein [Deltaproteobacteria bacterium]
MAKTAMLLTVGIDPQSHEGIRRMISMHFIQPGAMPVKALLIVGSPRCVGKGDR